MTKTTLFILILFLIISCTKEKESDFKSGILWKIESQSGVESFIFGTIHLYPEDEIILSDKAISKLQKCNVLALERDITNQAEQQKFTEFVMPKFIVENYGIIINEYGNELKSMESDLIEKALESKMKLTGLESTDEILQIIKETKNIQPPKIKFVKEEVLSDYHKTLAQYKSESIDEFYKCVTIQMGNEITKILVDKRNRNWIDEIESLIKKDKTFIAVGMAHLGGDNGLLNLLSEKGYDLKRIK